VKIPPVGVTLRDQKFAAWSDASNMVPAAAATGDLYLRVAAWPSILTLERDEHNLIHEGANLRVGSRTWRGICRAELTGPREHKKFSAELKASTQVSSCAGRGPAASAI